MYECKIAEKLVELRTSKGVTQEDVAQSLSISNKTVSKWENGASTPDLPMVIELAKYYGVTTDTLLGLSEDKKQSTAEEIRSLFEGLDRRESVQKAFEMMRAIVPCMLPKYTDALYDKEDVFLLKAPYDRRSALSSRDFFEFIASSDNVNVAVMMLRNRANFAWMNDPSKKKRIARIFKFLSNEDTLSVLYYIHSTDCSTSFTADYIAKNTGVKEELVSEILNEFCSVSETCNWATAQLAEGAVRVYECDGDGLMMSLIALAFERMCGSWSYDYHIQKGCKMIGGK